MAIIKCIFKKAEFLLKGLLGLAIVFLVWDAGQWLAAKQELRHYWLFHIHNPACIPHGFERIRFSIGQEKLEIPKGYFALAYKVGRDKGQVITLRALWPSLAMCRKDNEHFFTGEGVDRAVLKTKNLSITIQDAGRHRSVGSEMTAEGIFNNILANLYSNRPYELIPFHEDFEELVPAYLNSMRLFISKNKENFLYIDCDTEKITITGYQPCRLIFDCGDDVTCRVRRHEFNPDTWLAIQQDVINFRGCTM